MNEILIQTTETDRTTQNVLDWVFYYARNIKLVRKNNEFVSSAIGIEITNENFQIKYPNSLVQVKYWYRRGSLDILEKKNNFFEDNRFVRQIEQDLSNYHEIFNNFLQSIDNINVPSDNNINKLHVYILARKLKILFPKTWIGNTAENIPFRDVFLAKSLNSPSLSVIYNKYKIEFYSGSVLVNSEIDKQFPRNFLPSLFQEYIEKKYEIRTFYLKGVFKSMAIFSQQNEKTKIDFRNYDYERPNRCVPYNLPKSLEKKLHKLMLKLDINCGSMDILVTPNNEYYFLEVNPIGQFQWLSHNCNYFIERMIANDLCS